MKWFARFWRPRRPSRTARPAPTFRPTVDGLDERVMPSGCGASSTIAGAGIFGPPTAGSGQFGDSSVTRLSASLTGATGTAGHAHYHADATAGTNSLTLSVSGLTASSTYTIDVNGTSVGTITTDATGAGKVTLSDLSATVAAGSTITVVDSTGATVLSGTFAAPTPGGCHG
jgi:hypothetical protein